MRPRQSSFQTTKSLCATFEAYGLGAPGTMRDRWVEALARESQGWPQHLNRMAIAAAREISNCGFQIERASLERVLANSQSAREEYYEKCLGRAMDCPGLYKRLAMLAEDAGGVLTGEAIERLADPTLGNRSVTFEAFLLESIHAGLLSPTTPGRYAYRFPIPSMRRFLQGLPVTPAPVPE